MRKIGFLLIAVCLLAAMALAACGSTTGPTAVPADNSAPSADGAALLNERCSTCHSVDVPKGEKNTKAEWELLVGKMISRGAKLSDAEKATLVEYLAQTYGK
jgi:mono/diheme cytochrome c family protein